MLNREFIVDEWVPALRSGEYEQGQRTLHRILDYCIVPITAEDDKSHLEEFCCLGVACDILMKKGLLSGWEDLGGEGLSVPGTTSGDALSTLFPHIREGSEMALLPLRVAEYIGVTPNGSEVSVYVPSKNSNEYDSLVLANDCSVPFAVIADALEEFVKKGFV